MKRFLMYYKVGVKDLPFLLLLWDLISWIGALFDFYFFDYWWTTEIFSHSLATLFFMVYYAIKHKYCLYSWFCIIGLALVNLLNILHFFINFEYIQIYAGIIILTSLSFSVIKWKNLYYQHY